MPYGKIQWNVNKISIIIKKKEKLQVYLNINIFIVIVFYFLNELLYEKKNIILKK